MKLEDRRFFQKFARMNSDKFTKDLNDDDIMLVIEYITKMNVGNAVKRCWIQQFLLNWISVGAVASKEEDEI